MAHVAVKPSPRPERLGDVPGRDRPWLPVRVFQFPGNLVADFLKATDEDDRMAIRVLIDMLFWNLVVVIAAVLAYNMLG